MKDELSATPLPSWVPLNVQRYLLHTEAGFSIRDLARASGCHASTVLRQIRRIEVRRDDQLVDSALGGLADTYFRRHPQSGGIAFPTRSRRKELTMTPANTIHTLEAPECLRFDEQAVRILRRLCEVGAVLAVAEDMEKAVVVRGEESGRGTRTAVVDTEVARAMALRDWISCAKPGRISRYHITSAGRTALSRLLAEQENRMRSDCDYGSEEAEARCGEGARGAAREGGIARRRVRYSIAESPLVALARRKDRDGSRFLSDALVGAGERLREDFELAQMGPRAGQNWERFLTGGGRGTYQPDSGVSHGPATARWRVANALADLGPGLSDVALRCCCYLEGLETAERRLGWSARSGKIVLRIALQRLRRHYEELAEPDRMIG